MRQVRTDITAKYYGQKQLPGAINRFVNGSFFYFAASVIHIGQLEAEGTDFLFKLLPVTVTQCFTLSACRRRRLPLFLYKSRKNISVPPAFVSSLSL